MTEHPPRAPQQTESTRARHPRKNCLRSSSDFQNVFAKPVVSADRCFKVLARRNDCGWPRLGMAVSRQVDRKAVGRNRIKRVIRESFRQHFRDRRPALDFVVLPRRDCDTICNRRLAQSLVVHWKRLAGRMAAAARDA
ncbi:MAG: ribonuclease P protein component [Xanthomonadales bacterium]|nr:ribonuclease P protein component [Xanthomonadales bacterium]